MTIVCEDEQGLVFYRAGEIASMVLEMPGRCRVVSRDGHVSFRSDWPEGNWPRLGSARVNPDALVQLKPGWWSDPSGFVLVGTLEEVVSEPPPEPVWTSMGLPLHKVFGVRANGPDGCLWVTEEGEVAQAVAVEEAAAPFADLVKLKRGVFFHRQRLRRLLVDEKSVQLVMDDGQVLAALPRSKSAQLAQRLGLASLVRLEPAVPGLAGSFLRDWPFELATASAELLRKHFSSARKLIAHLIYQAFRYREQGIQRRYGRTHRGFWYRPVHGALYRAGFLSNRRARWTEVDQVARSSDEAMCHLYYRILEEMVGDQRLFGFADLGFKEVKPGERRLGKKRPEVLLVTEKESISDFGLAIHRRLGISYVETGGSPKLIASEFLARRWRAAGISEVRIVAFVDLDPDGWMLIDSLIQQLGRFGLKVLGAPLFVITGEQLTAEEIEMLTRPCENPESSKVQRWLSRGGGIGGRPWRYYANHFEPLERVLARVQELL
jgi:hypothetical protein